MSEACLSEFEKIFLLHGVQVTLFEIITNYFITTSIKSLCHTSIFHSLSCPIVKFCKFSGSQGSFNDRIRAWYDRNRSCFDGFNLVVITKGLNEFI